MKRCILLLSVLALLVVPVLAVAPLTELELASAEYDAATDRFRYEGRWYDGSGYPIEEENTDAEIENNVSIPETDAAETHETETPEIPADDAPTLIHSEDTSGSTQVNVFAIQTDDETGGTWIQGGSGESLTEKLFGPYTPYNASGIASVDWAWIADVVLFAILVICFFKIVAGVMKRV